jgi:hypothetical protein
VQTDEGGGENDVGQRRLVVRTLQNARPGHVSKRPPVSFCPSRPHEKGETNETELHQQVLI